jgi:hypothetical protein
MALTDVLIIIVTGGVLTNSRNSQSFLSSQTQRVHRYEYLTNLLRVRHIFSLPTLILFSGPRLITGIKRLSQCFVSVFDLRIYVNEL